MNARTESERADANPVAEGAETELYPIGAVADITGVNPITLRAWERRHRLIEPVRTPTGRRMYSRANIDLIERVVALLDRGMRIGQVKAELDAQDRRAARAAADGSDRWAKYRSRMTAAIIRFDEDTLEETYNAALSLYSIDEVTRELLNPLLVALGERWQSGTGSVAEEHFFGFYLRNKLGARFHHRSRGNQGPRVLAACLPSEQHENGLLLLSLALHERGFRVVSLGANLPLEEIAGAARQADCDAVILSGSMEPAPELLALRLPRMVAGAGVPVIVGGSVSVRCEEAVRVAGAEPVGDDLERGIARIEALLAARPRRARGGAGGVTAP